MAGCIPHAALNCLVPRSDYQVRPGPFMFLVRLAFGFCCPFRCLSLPFHCLALPCTAMSLSFAPSFSLPLNTVLFTALSPSFHCPFTGIPLPTTALHCPFCCPSTAVSLPFQQAAHHAAEGRGPQIDNGLPRMAPYKDRKSFSLPFIDLSLLHYILNALKLRTARNQVGAAGRCCQPRSVLEPGGYTASVGILIAAC